MANNISYEFVSCAFQYYTGTDYQTHTHQQWEAVLMIEGELLFSRNERKQILKRGDLLFMRPTDVCSFVKIGDIQPKRLTFLMENKTFYRFAEFLLPGIYDALLNENEPFYTSLDENGLKEFTNIADKSEKTSSSFSANSLNSFATKLVFGKVLDLSFDKTIFAKKNIPAWLEKYLEELKKSENFAKNLDELDVDTPYCRDHLTRLFTEYIGTTPRRYINDWKLSKAQIYLSSSDFTVAEIASKLGFESTSYFNNFFKKNYGLTPGEFRAVSREIQNPPPID